MKQISRWLSCMLLGLCVSLAQAKTEVIELQHRTGAELLPVINPFLEPYERATEWGYQLIIQADERKIGEIKQLIEQIDTPARRLLISVDTQGGRISNDNSLSANARIKGKHGDITLGSGARNKVEIKRYASQSRESGVRSVQTLEGSAALIQTGQQHQQRHWSVDQHGHPQQHISQRTLTQGFYVTAKVRGDRVTLELNNQHDSLDPQQQNITQTQSTSTRVSGPLNEWISVSNLNAEQNTNTSNVLSKNKSYSIKNNELRIKVELLD